MSKRYPDSFELYDFGFVLYENKCVELESKVSTGSILKSKNTWPYKTIKPDGRSLPLSKGEKLLLERRKHKNKNDLKS